jgi:predicted metal-binding membrane protein
VGSLLGVSALAWAYLVHMALAMPGMEAMPEMDAMPGMDALLRVRAWGALDFALMFLMWAVMMVGMMVPSAIPMTLVYAAVARKAAREGRPIGSPHAFVGGYVVVWTAFSVAATALQWGLERAALLSPMMVSTSPLLGAGLLVAAGVYQLTPYKEACLDKCRSPAWFIAERMRAGAGGALRLGIDHGWFCLGCCWALMGLLFFGGVMNLLWIAAIAVFVLLEKLLPAGARAGRVAGVGMIALGVALGAGLLSF